jgi:hypothetical protein
MHSILIWSHCAILVPQQHVFLAYCAVERADIGSGGNMSRLDEWNNTTAVVSTMKAAAALDEHSPLSLSSKLVDQNVQVVLDQPWYDPVAQCTALYRGLWFRNQPIRHGVAIYNSTTSTHNDGEHKDKIQSSTDCPASNCDWIVRNPDCDWKVYEGCWSNHQDAAVSSSTRTTSIACFEGSGRLVYTNDDVYTGSFHQSQRHGHGTYHWTDGRSYTGDWFRNQRTGSGIYTYAKNTQSSNSNGQVDYYQGEFVNGQRCGYGTFVFGATGASYRGAWRDGLYHGRGTTVDETGSVFEGKFCRGVPHGTGTCRNAAGQIVETGRWRHGVKVSNDQSESPDDNDNDELDAMVDDHGPTLETTTTTLTSSKSNAMARAPPPAAAPPPPPPPLSSSSMEPPVSTADNDPNGGKVSVVVDMYTTDTLSCPGHYTGMVVADVANSSALPRMQASSALTPSNGLQRPHGVGRMVYTDGSRIHEGFWVHGAKHGHGRCWFVPQGDVHEGEYCLNVRHGPGTYTWRDGRVYAGSYAHDERHGHGIFAYPNGERYEGYVHLSKILATYYCISPLSHGGWCYAVNFPRACATELVALTLLTEQVELTTMAPPHEALRLPETPWDTTRASGKRDGITAKESWSGRVWGKATRENGPLGKCTVGAF